MLPARKGGCLEIYSRSGPSSVSASLAKQFCVVLLLLLGRSSLAQPVRGTVSDATTCQPIGAAHVQWVDTSVGTATDRRGSFLLPRPPGARGIRITATGYVSTERSVADGERELALTMEPAPLALSQSTTVTARRVETDSFDVPEAVTVVSREEILQRLARTTPEALASQPGIWVQKTTHGGGSPIIRGMVGNQVLVLVDGIRLNNATYRYGPNQYLSTVDPGLVDRIEAIRGGGSVLYGSDAIGGVVQVLSRAPSFSLDGAHVSGRLSGQWMSGGMEASGRAEIEVGEERVAFLGGFSDRRFGDVLAGGGLGTLSPTGYREQDGDAKLLLRTGASGLLTAAFQLARQDDVPRYDQVALGGYARNSYDPQTRELAYVRWETLSASPWVQSLRLTGSFNRSVEGVLSRATGSPLVRRQRDETDTLAFVVEVASAPSPLWHAQSGVEYYADGVSSRASEVETRTGTETALRGSYADGSTASSLAAFTSHQVDWRGFQLSAGLRFNAVTVSVRDALFGDQRISPSAWVGNVGLTYALTPQVRAVALASTAFRSPNVDDMSRFGAVESTVFEIPSSELSPERSLSLEAGLKLSGKRGFGALTVYRTSLSDLIDRVPTTYEGSEYVDGRRVYQKQNVGEALVWGVEAEADVAILPILRAFGNVTYTHGENRTRQEPMRRIPPLFGRVGLNYRHGTGWWVKGELAAAGEQGRLAAGDRSDVRISSRLVDGVMPGWSCWNLYAGHQLGPVRLQASLQNLFDEGYRVYASGVDGYGRSARVMVILDLGGQEGGARFRPSQ